MKNVGEETNQCYVYVRDVNPPSVTFFTANRTNNLSVYVSFTDHKSRVGGKNESHV